MFLKPYRQVAIVYDLFTDAWIGHDDIELLNLNYNEMPPKAAGAIKTLIGKPNLSTLDINGNVFSQSDVEMLLSVFDG